MSFIFMRTPGKILTNADQQRQFEEARVLINQACNDLLIKPDYDACMRCVDVVNNIRNSQVLEEIVYCIRQKMGARQSTRTVFMAVSLAEILVKNCGMRLHAAIGQASFMEDLVKVARKHVGRTGEYYKDVAELILDVIQAWGEAFLTRQRQFPHIVGAYHQLRKEGFPFRPQYDPTRVPIFTPAGNVSKDNMNEDEILAAALAASIGDFESAGDRNGGERNFLTSEGHKRGNIPAGDRNIEQRRGSKSNTYGVGNANASSSEGHFIHSNGSNHISNLKDSVLTSLTLLAEIILGANNIDELMRNDIAHDLFLQLEQIMSKLPQIIENELMRNPDNLDENLFALNDDAQLVHSNYAALKKGLHNLSIAQKNLQKFLSPKEQQKKVDALVDKTFDLLEDFGVLQVTPAPEQSIEMTTSALHVIDKEKEVAKSKRPSGGSIPILQPPSSDTVRRTSKTTILDDPFNLNASDPSTSTATTSSNVSKTTLLEDLFGNSSSSAAGAASLSTTTTSNYNGSDPFADPFANTTSAIDSLLPAQQTKITNKVDPLSLYPNPRQQFQQGVYGNPNIQMPMPIPMQMQQSTMPIQQQPMYTNIVPSQLPQSTNITPSVGHVSNLIQKFDPNSPTRKSQTQINTNTNTNDNIEQKDSANPFDLF